MKANKMLNITDRVSDDFAGDNLILNDTYIKSLARSITNLDSVKNIPDLIRGVIECGMWKRRLVAQTKAIAEFDDFNDFVEAYAPEGLNTSVNELALVCQFLGDNDVVEMMSAEGCYDSMVEVMSVPYFTDEAATFLIKQKGKQWAEDLAASINKQLGK